MRGGHARDARLLPIIRKVHKANFEAYGYRRTWRALPRAGEPVPRCQVQRLMREHGILGAKRRGKPWRTTIPVPSAIRPPTVPISARRMNGTGTRRRVAIPHNTITLLAGLRTDGARARTAPVRRWR